MMPTELLHSLKEGAKGEEGTLMEASSPSMGRFGPRSMRLARLVGGPNGSSSSSSSIR